MSKPVTPPKLEPAILVIFGITGDLAQRKLLPALYHLFKDKLLDEHTEIVGLSRRSMTAEELLSTVELCVLEQDNVCDPDVMKEIRTKLRMVSMNPAEPNDYHTLLDVLDDIEDKHGVCMNRLYYLAIPPSVYSTVINNLGRHKLNGSCRHGNAKSRLLVEKPFGYDIVTAKELIRETNAYFHEDQVYRIDHYLAKESAQNILTFRQHNPMFLNSWNGKSISRIDVIAHEKIGVEGRATFYDQVGALRDIVQSHLLQLLALVMVDTPKVEGSIGLHSAKASLLDSLSPVDPTAAIRGQYEGYQDEVMNSSSLTETYVKLELKSNLKQWQGTVIGLETGKAMSGKKTEIHLEFVDSSPSSNVLTFRIQPNEGIDLQLTAKKPGFDHVLQKVTMDFSYRGVFDEPSHPDAYERVLVDAVRGDHSLFATSDEVLASWRALQPILDYWQNSTNLILYRQGAVNPEEETITAR